MTNSDDTISSTAATSQHWWEAAVVCRGGSGMDVGQVVGMLEPPRVGRLGHCSLMSWIVPRYGSPFLSSPFPSFPVIHLTIDLSIHKSIVYLCVNPVARVLSRS